MHRRLLCLLTLAAALPAAARERLGPPPPPEPVTEPPPGYICAVSRETASGTITAQQSVRPSGRAEAPIFGWSTRIGSGGIAVDASWSGRLSGYSLVFLTFDGQQPGRSYRLQIQRRPAPPGQTELMLDGALVPSGSGYVFVMTEWAPLTAMLAGAEAPHIRVIDSAGATVADENIDVATFQRARAMAEALRPHLRPMVSHYRNRCTYYDGGPINRVFDPVPLA